MSKYFNLLSIFSIYRVYWQINCKNFYKNLKKVVKSGCNDKKLMLYYTREVKIMAYVGKYNHQLDQKNRLRIPSRLKASLGNDFVILRGTRGCLFIYSRAEFEEKYESRVNEISISDESENDALIELLGTVSFPEEDNQGRFVLESNLRKLAKIEKNVVFVGVLTRIELWSEEEYEKRYTTNDKDNFDEAMKSLKKYGI
jgi:mraZ protein